MIKAKTKLVLLLAAAFMLLATAYAQTELEFWHAFTDNARSSWINDRIAEFNAQLEADGVPYKIRAENKGTYEDTLQAAILGSRQGTPPSIVQLYEIGSQLAIDSGIFAAAEDIGDLHTEEYIDPVLNYYKIDGKVHSVPFNSSGPILFARTDFLEAAGVEKVPETFSEVMAACEAAEAAGVFANGAKCIGITVESWIIEQLVAEQGAMLVDNDNGRSGRATEVLLTSDAVVRAAQFFKDLSTAGYFTYTGKIGDFEGINSIFTNGQAMFIVASTGFLNAIDNGVAGKFEYTTGLLPIPDGVERNGTIIGGASLWFPAAHSDEELSVALDFATYMTNGENMVSWHKLTGYYPARNSSVDILREEGWFEQSPNAATAFEQLLSTIPNDATGGSRFGTLPATRPVIEEAIQRIINGADVMDALTEAKSVADHLLDDYNANF